MIDIILKTVAALVVEDDLNKEDPSDPEAVLDENEVEDEDTKRDD